MSEKHIKKPYNLELYLISYKFESAMAYGSFCIAYNRK